MFFRDALPFVKEFIRLLNEALQEHDPNAKLTRKQQFFLTFCIMGILVTNTVSWAGFGRASLGAMAPAALSWMFRHAPIPWQWLLHMGVRVILRKFGIREGVLVTDDTDKKRAKVTTQISHTYKVYDKKTDGYFNGQTIVFLLLVTPKITIPVGFAFYCPDPKKKAWEKNDKRLKSQGITKKRRPPEPAKDPNYPTKRELSSKLISEFKTFHHEICIKAALGDNHYGTDSYMTDVENCLNCQVVSSLKASQNVRYRGRKISVSEYFRRHPPVKQQLSIRGGERVEVFVASARLCVPSHGGKKRFVMALRYTDQDEYTYVCATDVTWRTIDILECWTLRWLVEVFIEDFKEYEGWGQMAKQPGDEGSSRGLILSLLCDLALFLHPSQEACFENKQPAFTVGSLLRKARAQALLAFLQNLLAGQSGFQKLEELGAAIEKVFELKPSKKHMSGRVLGRMEPTPSLLHCANA